LGRRMMECWKSGDLSLLRVILDAGCW